MNEYEYLSELCKDFNLPIIRIRPITDKDISFDLNLQKIFQLHLERRGCFLAEDFYGLFEPIIFIKDELPDRIFLHVLRHEFRHYWQSIYYKELYNWWNNHRELYENKEIRNNYNVLEQDANTFAFNGTTSTIDQSLYTVEWLNKNIEYLYSLLKG